MRMFRYRSIALLVIIPALAVLSAPLSGIPAHAATTRVVTTNADGDCTAAPQSFRCALASAQDGDTITFNIPNCGSPCAIKVASGLSLSTSNVTVNGTNQADGLMVEIDGSNTTSPYGLQLGAFSSTGNASSGQLVEHLSFVNFTGANAGAITDGRQFGGPVDIIAYDYVGIAPDGTTVGPNTVGIRPGGGTVIHDNVISGNTGDGITSMSDGVSFYANKVGTDSSGNVARPNGGNGIDIVSDQGDCVGGLSQSPGSFTSTCQAETGNVVSGNKGDGVLVQGNGGTKVQSNLIGVGADGATHLGNGGNGVEAGTTGIIGGSGTLANTIAYNVGSGVKIGGQSAFTISQNRIHDNVTTVPATAGSAGEIYLTGQDPQTCNTSTSTSNQPNEYLPCPQILSFTGGTARVETCPGCTVELFSYHVAPNDRNSGGSVSYLGTMTDPQTACTTACTNNAANTVTFTNISASGVTATATKNDGTETSEFAQDVGNSTPTAARVAHFSARRVGTRVLFHWRLVTAQGVVGFHLFAHGRQLDRALIPVRLAGASYHYAAQWSGGGPYTLRVLLSHGQVVTVRAS